MKNEIDKDFYCTGDFYYHKLCNLEEPSCKCEKQTCRHYHRKWPTTKQFKEEYGEEYPVDGAVYFFDWYSGWRISSIRLCQGHKDWVKEIIVCACTPFGKPDKDWRPI